MCVCDSQYFKNNTALKYTELFNHPFKLADEVCKGLEILQMVKHREETPFDK